MDSKLERCCLLFQELGLTRIEGRILCVLLAGNALSAREIEKAADLRQPEVSKGIKKLLNLGWIRKNNTEGGLYSNINLKERPQKIYCLLVTKSQIFTELRDNLQIEYGKMEKNSSELKELLKVK